LVHIKSLEKGTINGILEERSHHGAFFNLEDLIHHTYLGPEQLNTFIRVGALRFTGKNKKELVWQANFLYKQVGKVGAVFTALFQEKNNGI
jgi:DNA polymerase III alpha subunit